MKHKYEAIHVLLCNDDIIAAQGQGSHPAAQLFRPNPPLAKPSNPGQIHYSSAS